MRLALALLLLATYLLVPCLELMGYEPVYGATSCNIDVTAQGSDALAIPDVTTGNGTVISGITATINGTVTDAHGGIIEERGFDWGAVSGGPYTEDWTEIGPYAAGSFNVTTTFWVGTVFFRAKAKNSQGWGYGAEENFTIALTLPDAPTNFDAEACATWQCVSVEWTKDPLASHTLVMRKVGSYPENIADGVQVYYGTGNTTTDVIDITFLDEAIYYRAWSWNAVGWSLTYAQDVVEVTGSMANALMLMGMIFLGLGLTFGGYWSKRWPIVIASAAIWLAFSLWAFNNSAETWDIYRWFGVVGIIMLLIALAEPLVMREKPTLEAPKSEMDQMVDDQIATWKQNRALTDKMDESMGRRPRRRRTVSEEDTGIL